MNVNRRFTFTEDQLRSIRAHESRGGRATRAEARTWLERVVEIALDDLPAPKRRRKAVPDEPAAIVGGAPGAGKSLALQRRATREVIETLPDEARCARCDQRKDEHGRMGFACPAPNRGTFEPIISSQ